MSRYINNLPTRIARPSQRSISFKSFDVPQCSQVQSSSDNVESIIRAHMAVVMNPPFMFIPLVLTGEGLSDGAGHSNRLAAMATRKAAVEMSRSLMLRCFVSLEVGNSSEGSGTKAGEAVVGEDETNWLGLGKI